ncbi:MAG: hypothetical protein ACRDJW_05920 [Thermomicrobiales bacterium]
MKRTREASRGSPTRPTARASALLPGRLRAARPITLLLALLVWAAAFPPLADAGPGLGQVEQAPTVTARSAPERVRSELLRLYPSALQPAADEGELDDLEVRFIDADLDPETVLRSRPFILGPESLDAYPSDTKTPRAMTVDHARDRLERFLNRRELSFTEREAALVIYDDPTVQTIVPAPNLRAGLLMLTGWDPYQITIDAVLDGANPSGRPFEALEFSDIGLEDAVATIDYSPNGRFRMIFNEQFAGESPEQLIPVIVHESLHGGGANSRQEEVIANILDTICYGELVLIDPRIVDFGTDLAIFNNVELLALLNSMGHAGGGALGISSSPLGDVFVGPNLEDLDAESIQAVIESDPFYGALPPIGSAGQATSTALLHRFPGGDRLGDEPRFDDAALAVIDEGVAEVITARDATRLARILGLLMTGDVIEVPFPTREADALAQRPFIPTEPELFSPRYAVAAGDPPSENQAEAALDASLIAAGVDLSTRLQVVDKIDDGFYRRLIPDPSLRGAALMLEAIEPWQSSAAVIFDGTDDDGEPVAVEFADLRGSAPVAFVDDLTSPDGKPAILVNSWLRAEPLPVLASYLVEATLVRADEPTEDEAVTAALLGTLSYADFVDAEPDLVAHSTWGVIQRNRDLLALINSSSWAPDLDNLNSVGFLGPSNGAIDILPNLYDDAASFAEFITARPRAVDLERRATTEAPPVFVAYLIHAGVEPRQREGRPTFDAETLGELDARLGAFLSPDDALSAAGALELGAA